VSMNANDPSKTKSKGIRPHMIENLIVGCVS
jgi:hypothetical protein